MINNHMFKSNRTQFFPFKIGRFQFNNPNKTITFRKLPEQKLNIKDFIKLQLNSSHLKSYKQSLFNSSIPDSLNVCDDFPFGT